VADIGALHLLEIESVDVASDADALTDIFSGAAHYGLW
jgi:hypothetical protein